MPTKTRHLRYSDDVIIAAANEAKDGFPCILLEDSHAREFWSFFLEIGIGCRPLLVQDSEVGLQVQIVIDQCLSIVVGTR